MKGAVYGLQVIFELSQAIHSSGTSWKKANYFYENILATADKPTDDREVAFPTTNATTRRVINEDMLVALIRKVWGCATVSLSRVTSVIILG